MRFSGTELTQIVIAVAALTLAFTIAQIGGVYAFGFSSANLSELGLIALASFVAVITAFLLHELAHKALAQRYGCYAEFRAYPMGLLIGILTAAFGFLFAAPGAVMISGSVSPRQNARISAAGPGTNFALAGTFFGLWLVLGAGPDPLVPQLIATVAFVNLFL